MESLWRETAPLGNIRTLLIEPGRFRTKFLSSSNRKTKASEITDYNELSQSKNEGLAKEDQRQPGDPVKLVEIVLDLVREEGVAAGKEIPFRLPLGVDAYEEIKKKVDDMQRLLEEWAPTILSTNYDE